jgi:hypothetical protein
VDVAGWVILDVVTEAGEVVKDVETFVVVDRVGDVPTAR